MRFKHALDDMQTRFDEAFEWLTTNLLFTKMILLLGEFISHSTTSFEFEAEESEESDGFELSQEPSLPDGLSPLAGGAGSL